MVPTGGSQDGEYNMVGSHRIFLEVFENEHDASQRRGNRIAIGDPLIRLVGS